jgi:hypothetical protein
MDLYKKKNIYYKILKIKDKTFICWKYKYKRSINNRLNQIKKIIKFM